MSETQHDQNDASTNIYSGMPWFTGQSKPAARTRKLSGQRQRHLHDMCHM